MIRKSLIITTLLLAAYAACLYLIKPQPVTCEIFKTNVAIAQTFLYEEKTQSKDVIIGTSLADKMRIDNSLPSDVYFLTFLGQHLFDGLDVLEHSGTRPKYVFIETNSILNQWNTALPEYLYETPYFSIRKHLTILRTGYEPASIASKPVEKLITPITNKVSQKVLSPAIGMLNIQKRQTVDEEFYTKKLEERFSNISDSFATARFSIYKQKVDQLIKEGSTVFFFTMPVSEHIKRTKMAEVTERYYKQYFPYTEYNYVTQCNDSDYKTIDGLHLDDSSALRYAAFFKTELTKCRFK